MKKTYTYKEIEKLEKIETAAYSIGGRIYYPGEGVQIDENELFTFAGEESHEESDLAGGYETYRRRVYVSVENSNDTISFSR